MPRTCRTYRPPRPARDDGPTQDFIRLVAAGGLDTDECIEWPYYRNAAGYGVVQWQKDRRPAHRVVLALAVGEPAPPTWWRHAYPYWYAAHKPVICHNPPCINPRHLYWASAKQNSADRWLDGTMLRKIR